MVELLVILGWIGAQQKPARRLAPVIHVVVSVAIAGLLVLLIKNPPEVDISALATMVFTLLLAIIVEAVSVATDKADLLNRLRDD